MARRSTGLGRGYGPVVRQTRTGMNECSIIASNIRDVMELDILECSRQPSS
jgi:hypothetical protein